MGLSRQEKKVTDPMVKLNETIKNCEFVDKELCDTCKEVAENLSTKKEIPKEDTQTGKKPVEQNKEHEETQKNHSTTTEDMAELIIRLINELLEHLDKLHKAAKEKKATKDKQDNTLGEQAEKVASAGETITSDILKNQKEATKELQANLMKVSNLLEKTIAAINNPTVANADRLADATKTIGMGKEKRGFGKSAPDKIKLFLGAISAVLICMGSMLNKPHILAAGKTLLKHVTAEQPGIKTASAAPLPKPAPKKIEIGEHRRQSEAATPEKTAANKPVPEEDTKQSSWRPARPGRRGGEE